MVGEADRAKSLTDSGGGGSGSTKPAHRLAGASDNKAVAFKEVCSVVENTPQSGSSLFFFFQPSEGEVFDALCWTVMDIAATEHWMCASCARRGR